MKRIIVAIASVIVWLCGAAITDYDFNQCQGSLMPYPAPDSLVAYPDSLTPVMINHVGRHGSRYPASTANYVKMRAALLRADSVGSITELGRDLLGVVDQVISLSDGRWGALDSLGKAEQRGIATRMFKTYPELLKNAKAHAISSYSPRAMMSMYSFTHQLDWLNRDITFFTSTGKLNDALLRPFDIDEQYIEWRKWLAHSKIYEDYFLRVCPLEGIEKVLGVGYPYADRVEACDLAITEYYCLAGLEAMSLPNVMDRYLTLEQANALWSCFNLRQYLQRTASSVSDIPATIAGALVADMVMTTDEVLSGASDAAVQLRFGHAETLMPLLSLIQAPGCYYLSPDLSEVAGHWCDFYVVPMAANLQMIVFRGLSGAAYVRFDLNERPISLPGLPLYAPWPAARAYLLSCLPQ